MIVWTIFNLQYHNPILYIHLLTIIGHPSKSLTLLPIWKTFSVFGYSLTASITIRVPSILISIIFQRSFGLYLLLSISHILVFWNYGFLQTTTNAYMNLWIFYIEFWNCLKKLLHHCLLPLILILFSNLINLLPS